MVVVWIHCTFCVCQQVLFSVLEAQVVYREANMATVYTVISLEGSTGMEHSTTCLAQHAEH